MEVLEISLLSINPICVCGVKITLVGEALKKNLMFYDNMSKGG